MGTCIPLVLTIPSPVCLVRSVAPPSPCDDERRSPPRLRLSMRAQEQEGRRAGVSIEASSVVLSRVPLALSTGIDAAFRDNSSTRYERASASRENIAAGEDTTDRRVEALTSLPKVRSNHYFIANFDPSTHNIDVRCEKWTERGKQNGRDDNECWSCTGNRLKGDARVCLNEWLSNDHTCTNLNVPQATEKLDSCMLGLYRILTKLPHNRYKLELLAGSYGKQRSRYREYVALGRGVDS
ncbi:hypothetical protein EVAR_93793_1 [Eumeta japonica]|uniref:Uncharacterized protein n=1 Tax=Eumeta variegata TaxID=151549 RepID=A0A4C1VC42_EUMVA|nr:hypothetical protein EVAR_93793_1 [Eumeta japonica]